MRHRVPVMADGFSSLTSTLAASFLPMGRSSQRRRTAVRHWSRPAARLDDFECARAERDAVIAPQAFMRLPGMSTRLRQDRIRRSGQAAPRQLRMPVKMISSSSRAALPGVARNACHELRDLGVGQRGLMRDVGLLALHRQHVPDHALSAGLSPCAVRRPWHSPARFDAARRRAAVTAFSVTSGCSTLWTRPLSITSTVRWPITGKAKRRSAEIHSLRCFSLVQRVRLAA